MLELKNISKKYIVEEKDLHALKDINISIEDGERFSIIGLSGAGKSTLFKTIIGLEKPDSGEILVDNINILALNKEQHRKYRKKLGVVFQGYALLMQKNVFDNIALPLVLEKWKKEDIEKRVNKLLDTVGLQDKGKAYPAMLSGGQMQRVAIARGLALNPKLLLLDEITSALDPINSNQIIDLLVKVNQKSGVTMLFVTHEIPAVVKFATRVAVMNYGAVVEIGKTKDILNNPQADITKALLAREV